MGNELSRPIFSPEPLIFAEREKFSAYLCAHRRKDPPRYIVLNATAPPRAYTYVRNNSRRHVEISRAVYHPRLQLKYDGVFAMNYTVLDLPELYAYIDSAARSR